MSFAVVGEEKSSTVVLWFSARFDVRKIKHEKGIQILFTQRGSPHKDNEDPKKWLGLSMYIVV